MYNRNTGSQEMKESKAGKGRGGGGKRGRGGVHYRSADMVGTKTVYLAVQSLVLSEIPQ